MGGVALIADREWLYQVPDYVVVDRLLLAGSFAFILLEQNYALHSVVKISQIRFLSYWGNYTYGFYCLHSLALLTAFQIMRRLGLNHQSLGVVIGDNALELALVLGISWLSFTFYEKRFLKLKNHFAFITH